MTSKKLDDEEYEEVEEEVEEDEEEEEDDEEVTEFAGMTEAEYEAELKRRVQEKLALLRKKNVCCIHSFIPFVSHLFPHFFFSLFSIMFLTTDNVIGCRSLLSLFFDDVGGRSSQVGGTTVSERDAKKQSSVAVKVSGATQVTGCSTVGGEEEEE